MKYANSLKYLNSFELAKSPADISVKRVSELCTKLGRINIGTPCICLPGGSAGHACAVMLESVIKCSGHTVGRIAAAHGFDSRLSVLINGEASAIENYNKAVAEIKSAVNKTPEESYTKEEITFVLGLLLCKLSECEYILLEGLLSPDCALDSVCAPYDLIVMPSVYENDGAPARVKMLCDAIRRGTREVVSGNQKSEVYNKISNACVLNGVRLCIPVKAQFEVTEMTARRMTFNYGGREGYVVKSPSYILRDCAMTVIECALSLRRRGVKMPWSGISAGLAAASNMGCFETVSVSPQIIIDTAGCIEEMELVVKTGADILGDDEINDFSICIDESYLPMLKVMNGRRIKDLIVITDKESIEIGECSLERLALVPDFDAAAKAVCDITAKRENAVCCGDAQFAHFMKSGILKILNN